MEEAGWCQTPFPAGPSVTWQAASMRGQTGFIYFFLMGIRPQSNCIRVLRIDDFGRRSERNESASVNRRGIANGSGKSSSDSRLRIVRGVINTVGKPSREALTRSRPVRAPREAGCCSAPGCARSTATTSKESVYLGKSRVASQIARTSGLTGGV